MLAFLIMGWSIYDNWEHVSEIRQIDKQFVSKMLHSVGAMVISVAIFDVAKYLIDEAILKDGVMKSAIEIRESLTKIITIVAIAISVEGLIFIFKAGSEDISLLIYPALLIASALFVVIGLGLYIKFNCE